MSSVDCSSHACQQSGQMCCCTSSPRRPTSGGEASGSACLWQRAQVITVVPAMPREAPKCFSEIVLGSAGEALPSKRVPIPWTQNLDGHSMEALLLSSCLRQRYHASDERSTPNLAGGAARAT